MKDVQFLHEAENWVHSSCFESYVLNECELSVHVNHYDLVLQPKKSPSPYSMTGAVWKQECYSRAS